MDLAHLRREYAADDPETEFTPAADPFELLRSWLADALAAGNPEPNAMSLCTVDDAGAPHARMVLLREVVEGELRFFTNLHSPKAAQLSHEARCALVLWWPEIERQVRVEGRAQGLARELAAAYFATRPRGSQLGAWASPQSRPIASRQELRAALAEAERRFADADVPLPPHWGGFAVVPTAFEFWRGRASRLHERVRLERDGARWSARTLAP